MAAHIIIDYDLTERLDDSEIQQQLKRVSSNATLVSVLEAMPHSVMILNHCRQIVWANASLFLVLTNKGVEQLAGQRPGEAFRCVNAMLAEKGCGTAKECQTCGALQAILQSLDNNGAEQECMILTLDNQAYNLRVKAGPVEIEGEVFICISVVDISDQKNRRMMERLFFHDIMNVAGAIQGLTDILVEMAPDTDKAQAELLEVISENAKDLIELLKSQKDLLSAENNELSVYSKEIRANQLLYAVKRFFERNEQYKNRHIEIQTCQDDSLFSCDERLLKRVIVNAVKNALEAVSEGETVQIRYTAEKSSVVFEIHDHSFIPEDVQSQIFRKSFSTKGTDRGIGTYSIKLFTEKYLKGKAWFVSEKDRGTTFYIQVPTGL